MPLPKINDETIAALIRLVSSGVPYETAADSVMITDRTLYKWLRRGRASTKKTCPYRQLVQGLKKAHADAITRNVAIIQKAAQKTWQAAAWWLERREPDKFGSEGRTIRELKSLVIQLTKDGRVHLNELPPSKGKVGDSSDHTTRKIG